MILDYGEKFSTDDCHSDIMLVGFASDFSCELFEILLVFGLKFMHFFRSAQACAVAQGEERRPGYRSPLY